MAMNPSRSRFWQTRSLDSLRTAYCTWLDRKNRLLRRLQPFFWHGAHPVASHPIARQPEHPGTPWHTGGTGGVPEHIGAESPESHNAPGFSAIGGGRRLGLEQWNTPRAKAATRDLPGYVTRGTQYDTWSTYQGQYSVTSRGKCMEGAWFCHF
jgi:hypothetical protein